MQPTADTPPSEPVAQALNPTTAPPYAGWPSGLQQALPLRERFEHVRRASVAMCAPLSPEDLVVQTCYEVSPLKWHLGHTTWLIEHFILEPAGVSAYEPTWHRVFNSYYESAGPRVDKNLRGALSRPTVRQIMAYRAYVDAKVARLIDRGLTDAQATLIRLALEHEQQHQELMWYDIRHILFCVPWQPAYPGAWSPTLAPLPDTGGPETIDLPEGLVIIGSEAAQGWAKEKADAAGAFAYDNEGPAHRQYLSGGRLARGLVTEGAYAHFVAEGGYKNPRWWLSDGWARCQAEGWQAPLYWQQGEGEGWSVYDYCGVRPLSDDRPVAHLSYYEADAYARWAGARLPTEAELEALASGQAGKETLPGFFGHVWQYTRTAYLPYPGYAFDNNGLGEYNGKFMAGGQMVLRGSSRATPPGHARATYRNFFEPGSRWQLAGLRLAWDAY